MVAKKLHVILSLLVVTAVAEKKINLEDIERDNLRAESKSSSDNVRAEDAAYTAPDKPQTNQQEYQQPPQQYQINGVAGSYAPQQLQDKYAIPSEDYSQEGKYVENNVGYQQTSQPVQQYVTYQQQQQQQQQQVETAAPNSFSHAPTYEAPQQQLLYQQEVAVGNQFQSVQQKVATEKYLKNSNKDTLYVNIPMEQLLSYYPHLLLNQPSISKHSIQPLLHRLATQAAQQIAIPVYAPTGLRREPIYTPSKVEYQIEPQYFSYPTKYPQHTEAILPTKQPKKLIYTQSLLSHQQPPQAQPQQYLQEIVYGQPGAIYAPAVSSSHAEVYARPSVSLQGNSLGHSYASQTIHQQRYPPAGYSLRGRYFTIQAPSTLAPQQSQIYQQQSGDVQENYEAAPESPGSGFDLPRLPAQNFKSGSGLRLQAVHSERDGLQYAQNHVIPSSGHKSLLDSYIPSRIIAAQDSERYRERPIKLETGFLPSKINFVQTYKKRKAE